MREANRARGLIIIKLFPKMDSEQNAYASTMASSSLNLSMSMSTVASTVRSQPARHHLPPSSYGRGRACVAYQRARAAKASQWYVPTARARNRVQRYRSRYEAAYEAREAVILEQCRLAYEARSAKEAEAKAAKARAAEAKAVMAKAAKAREAAAQLLREDLVPKLAPPRRALDDFDVKP